MLPEVVFACTVDATLRQDAYIAGLRNLLLSASRFAVIVDHMRSHDYLNDLITLKSTNKELENSKFYYYDSGLYFNRDLLER